MNTQQLESFLQVAENLNFARAAEVLNVTQSAVSRQIQTLEEELGAKLFFRTTRTVTLTPEGVIFLEHATQVLGQLRLAAARVQHHSSTGARILRIGCESETDLDFLCTVLAACRGEIQAFHPYLRIVPHRALLNLFFQGELEVLFGFSEGLPLRNEVDFVPLRQVPLCCVVPAGNPLATRQTVDEETLFRQQLVLCSAYALPARVVELQNRIAQRLYPEQVHLSESPQVVRTLVRAGYGCAILPRPSGGTEGLAYLPLEGVPPLTYGLCYARTSDNGLLRRFVEIARTVAAP